jgi:hypothetical protein
VPPEVGYLLEWFFSLVGLHTSGMSVNPLQPTEVEAWFRLMGIVPSPWEVDTIFRMDAAFLERLHNKKSRKGKAMVDAQDGAAVSGLFRSLGPRKSNGSMISRHGISD